ncbi:MAG: restriction endonuclease subunit S [Campylobacter lanienae]|uniref:restriction endonuclease subunit S n=1 Tax=Campylobacter lanienae TaxID=75658 RepID=UPI002430D27D|nr:restriction endonuclease subunit S [Campylobacter lanienae]MCI5539510.1 restriction endonuclease subunit S [Campylobacter lanienae]
MAKIKKDTNLRKSILQAAITGQLISNVEGETKTGKELLDKIIEERNKKLLADWEEAKKKNPKAKKPAPIAASEITEDEIPFEIPKSWCWCRLGDVVYKLTDGTHRTPKYVEKGIPFLSVKNLSSGKMDFSNIRYITEQEHKELYSRCNPEKGDMLLTKVGTTGIPVINDSDIEFSLFVSVALIKYPHHFVNEKFFLYLLQSPLVQEQAKENTRGVGNKNWVMDAIANTLLVLPPLAVQNAIVAKLEEVLPLVDAYENAVLQKEELKTALPDKVKKAILQEAIQGKLTKSWRKTATIEESGKQLLDRIIEERNAKLLADWEEAKKKNPKAKKPAPIAASEITEDEIPFEIPKSWCWCRLGDVGDWKAGSTPSRSNPEFYNGNIPWLKTGDLTDDFVDIIPECISEIALKSCSMRLNPVGSVLIAMYGATIGKLGILNIEATTNQACCACITHEPISNKYMFYYLMSQKKALTEKAEGGAQPNISREKLVIYPFPLPPLAEQEKIVEIIEQMLPLCEKLGG